MDIVLSKLSNPLPKRLKEARTAYGISQKSLGIAIGVDEFSSSARINQYETGKHAPDYLTMANIAKFLGYPVSYFYEPDDEVAALLFTYTKLNKSEKKLLLNVLSQNFK